MASVFALLFSSVYFGAFFFSWNLIDVCLFELLIHMYVCVCMGDTKESFYQRK